MQFYQLADLNRDMKRNNQSIEQFYVTYANIKFDVIFDIGVIPYELLIGAVNHSWACTLKVKKGYEISMSDNDFYALCNLLNLKPGRESLTSFKFILFIAEHAPHECSNKLVEPTHLVPFRAKNISAEDEPDKVIFHGWNDHKKDGKKARNFDKTELLLGKACADYCRRNNISSMWTTDKSLHKPICYPWNDK